MKSTDYLEMPELVKSNYSVTLDEKEWNKYQELKDDLVLELPGGEITASNAAVLSNKLIQMANGAIYDENGEFVDVHSKKLEALEDLIESANGKPVLVAYWFKHDLERIEKHLKSKKIEFARLDSDKSIEDWNNGKISVALIHPASTGHGLNLRGWWFYNYMVWTYLVFRIVRTNKCKIMASRSKSKNGSNRTYYFKRHY